MLFAAVAFLFISVWGFQQRGDAMKKAKEAENSRAEAEFRKKESDSLRTIAEGRATVADMEKMLAQMNADSAEQTKCRCLFKSKISEQQKLIAFQQAEEAAKKNTGFPERKGRMPRKQLKKPLSSKVSQKRKRTMEFNKRMLSIAQTMSGKVSEVEDKNLKGLLAYQAYLFNREYDGQTDHPDIYNALYNALAGFNGEKFNGLAGT